MALPLPSSLTPSKVSTFTDCALAFRFSVIDRVPEPPSVPAVRGSLVHRALELLMWAYDPPRRSLAAALDCLDRAVMEFAEDPEFCELGLEASARDAFIAEAEALVRHYFELEDPNAVTVLGVELGVELGVGDLTLRGIIDRLELDADGALVITDYKTGRAPKLEQERRRLGGVQFYAFLCERVLGIRPARVQLLYLADPVAIVATPTQQSILGLERRAHAVWTAIERSCAAEDFRPNRSRLCEWCAFREWCPAFGGDPTQAPVPTNDVQPGQARGESSSDRILPPVAAETPAAPLLAG